MGRFKAFVKKSRKVLLLPYSTCIKELATRNCSISYVFMLLFPNKCIDWSGFSIPTLALLRGSGTNAQISELTCETSRFDTLAVRGS